MNKKGVSLIELLVSVVLISIVMIFMYALMIDIKKKQLKVDIMTDTQLKLGEVELYIQNKLTEKLAEDLNVNDGGGNPCLEITKTDSNTLLTIKKFNNGAGTCTGDSKATIDIKVASLSGNDGITVDVNGGSKTWTIKGIKAKTTNGSNGWGISSGDKYFMIKFPFVDEEQHEYNLIVSYYGSNLMVT